MTLKNANAVRAEFTSKLMQFLSEQNEDCGMIASNSFNLPVVVDGEEGWIEIVVKVPKDEGDEGFLKREDYTMSCKEKAAKAAEKEKAKAAKIERDKAARAAKAKAREQRAAEI